MLALHFVTYADIIAITSDSLAGISCQFDGRYKLRPEVLDAITQLTGNYAFASELQQAIQKEWVAKHPDADAADHMQSRTVTS